MDTGDGGAAGLGRARALIKAVFDALAAAVLLVVLAPVMFTCTALIKATDPREPVFTSAVRRGRRGDVFEMLGFRIPAGRVGRLIRKFSFDHLPELFNVLSGEMSMVGPRPRPTHDDDASPLDLRPGLTGLWVLSTRGEPTPADLADIEQTYARTWSIAGDIRIIGRAAAAVRERE